MRLHARLYQVGHAIDESSSLPRAGPSNHEAGSSRRLDHIQLLRIQRSTVIDNQILWSRLIVGLDDEGTCQDLSRLRCGGKIVANRREEHKVGEEKALDSRTLTGKPRGNPAFSAGAGYPQ